MPYDIDEVVHTTVTCTAWLVRAGYPDLALTMRDEFLTEWEVPDEMWDYHIDALVDYVERKGETPEISIMQLNKIRRGVISGN